MGTIAATFTPMDKMGEVNLEKITDYAKKLKKDRLSGVFICGTTGGNVNDFRRTKTRCRGVDTSSRR